MKITMDPIVEEIFTKHAQENMNRPDAEGWEREGTAHTQVLGEGECYFHKYQKIIFHSSIKNNVWGKKMI